MALSGTFCATITALECLAKEKVVDVYQTVKRVRKCNPRAVKTKVNIKGSFQSYQCHVLKPVWKECESP